MTVDWVDVDKENTNPFFVSTYVNDIFEHYRRREVSMHCCNVDDYLPLSTVLTHTVDSNISIKQRSHVLFQYFFLGLGSND